MAAGGGGLAFAADGGAGGGGNLEAKITPTVIISCVMAGIIFGYDIHESGGVISIPPILVEKDLESNYPKNDHQERHLFRSYFYLAGLTATFLASYTTRKLGTRLTMLIAGFFFIVGLVFTVSAQNLTMLIVGRILLGCGVGLGANQAEVGDSRFKGCERIHYTKDQLLQLRNNAQAAPLFSGGASPLLPSTIDVIPVAATYDQGMTRKKIEIPKCRVGVIIGRGGETIKYLTLQSGAKIQLSSDMDAAADPNSQNRLVELMGTPEAIAFAEKLINEILARQADEFSMKIPNHTVGVIIGKRGDTIKSMQASSGARIQVIPLHLSPGYTSTTERTLKIVGAPHQIQSAKHLVNLIMTMPGSGSGGGYSQQGGYQLQSQYCSCFRAGIPPAAPPPPPPPHWLPHSEANGHSTAKYLPAPHPQPGFDGPPQAPPISYGNTSSSYGAGYAHKHSDASDVANGVAPAQAAPQQGGGVAKVKLH